MLLSVWFLEVADHVRNFREKGLIARQLPVPGGGGGRVCYLTTCRLPFPSFCMAGHPVVLLFLRWVGHRLAAALRASETLVGVWAEKGSWGVSSCDAYGKC